MFPILRGRIPDSVLIYTSFSPCPVSSCSWLVDGCPSNADVSFLRVEVKMFVRIVRNVFYDLENLDTFGARPEFCETPGQSSVKHIQPGLSREG